MKGGLPHLATRIFGAPLAIQRARLETILAVIGPRFGLQEVGAAVPGESKSRRAYAVTPEGVAVVNVLGTLVQRASGLEAASGLTSYERLAGELTDAAADPMVRAILLDVDSPGGEVPGVADLAERVRAVRARKPVWAVANEQAYSAAYWIASAASRLYIPETGSVGSIGVIAVHLDQSEADKAEGLRYTLIYSGDRKADFSPHEPLSDRARATLQAEVDRVRDIFVDAVARGRGLKPEAVRGTEAAIYFGPRAVDAGLADAVGGFDRALADLTQSLTGRAAGGARRLAAREEMAMSEEQGQAPRSDNVVDLEQVRSEARGEAYGHAEAVAELCALAGAPERAHDMIKRRLTPEAARRELLADRAGGPEVRSHILPGAATGVGLDAATNPLIRASERIAKAQKGGA